MEHYLGCMHPNRNWKISFSSLVLKWNGVRRWWSVTSYPIVIQGHRHHSCSVLSFCFVFNAVTIFVVTVIIAINLHYKRNDKYMCTYHTTFVVSVICIWFIYVWACSLSPSIHFTKSFYGLPNRLLSQFIFIYMYTNRQKCATIREFIL